MKKLGCAFRTVIIVFVLWFAGASWDCANHQSLAIQWGVEWAVLSYIHTTGHPPTSVEDLWKANVLRRDGDRIRTMWDEERDAPDCVGQDTLDEMTFSFPAKSTDLELRNNVLVDKATGQRVRIVHVPSWESWRSWVPGTEHIDAMNRCIWRNWNEFETTGEMRFGYPKPTSEPAEESMDSATSQAASEPAASTPSVPTDAK